MNRLIYEGPALLEGICATLNSHIQALKQSRYKVGYLFEGCHFGSKIAISCEARKKQKLNACKKYQLYVSNT